MSGRIRIIRAAAAGIAVLLVLTTTAWGQVTAVSQVLEEVLGIGSGFVLRVESNNPNVDFSQLDVDAADIRACSLTAKGLYCLVGNDVYLWSGLTPLASGASAENPGTYQFSCRNDAFNLDTKKANTCTSMTVNPPGNTIVIGGKDKGKAYSAHVVQKCDAPNPVDGLSSLGGAPDNDPRDEDYCQKQLTTGRPLIVDMWTLPVSSNLGPGTLVLEQRTDAAIILFNGDVVAGPGGGKDWGLAGNEKLLGLTTIKLDEVAFPGQVGIEYYVATTTKGRIVAVSSDTNAVPSNFEVFDIQMDGRNTPIDPSCPANDPQFGIRTGFKSGLVYVSDREFCQLLVLEPVATSDPSIEGPFDLSLLADETISTTSLAPTGITVAPGISLNLLACGETDPSCPVIPDGEGGADAEYIGVELIPNLPSGVTIFQIKNGPDCRYIPEVCAALLGGPDGSPEDAVGFLVGQNVIKLAPDEAPGCWLTDVADCNPGGWRQNNTPLLPDEITTLFDDSGIPPTGLPEMLFSRQYRAQKENNFTWEALFAVLEEGVIFEGTFEAFYDTEALVTSGVPFAYGCSDTPANLTEALEWSVVTTVSETYRSGLPDEYRDWLTNFACGSSRSSKKSLSLDAYNLEIAPCTEAYSDDAVWESDGLCSVWLFDEDIEEFVAAVPEVVDDAVFFKLALSLWDDYGAVLSDFACQANDPPGQAGAPLLSLDCATLEAGYLNTTDKFEKCWFALQQPKQSAGNQNCQSFESQLLNFENDLAVAIQNAPDAESFDPANRTGELESRLSVLRYLLDTRVFAIEPADGYCEPESSCAAP